MEKLADGWVQKCIFDHPKKDEYPDYEWIGQNLAVQFGLQQVSYVTLAQRWKGEVKDFILFNNTCKHVCGHYTQARFFYHYCSLMFTVVFN